MPLHPAQRLPYPAPPLFRFCLSGRSLQLLEATKTSGPFFPVHRKQRYKTLFINTLQTNTHCRNRKQPEVLRQSRSFSRDAPHTIRKDHRCGQNFQDTVVRHAAAPCAMPHCLHALCRTTAAHAAHPTHRPPPPALFR